MRGAGARAGGGDGGGDSRESGDRLGEAGAAQERSSDSNCARLEERDSEPELVGDEARSRRRRFAGHAHSRSDSLSHSDPDRKETPSGIAQESLVAQYVESIRRRQ